MELVVDANILFAALIKVSVTSDLIADDSLNLFSSEFILSEFRKYEELIKNKTYRNNDEFDNFMEIMEKKIKLIPNEEIEPFVDEAIKISPDPKDIHYFALALKLKIPIWSNDRILKAQKRIRVYSTDEIKNILKK